MVWKKVRRGRALGTAAGIIVFFALLLAVSYGAGADESPSTDVNNTSSVTGVTYTKEMPFSKESIKEIKEHEHLRPAVIQKQVIIPFHREPPPKELPDYGTPQSPKAKPQSAVSIASTGSSLAPALSNNFSGLSDSGLIPPDTMGAVGPSHLMEIINGRVGFFEKLSGILNSSMTLQAFWSSLGTNPGEPAYYPFDPKVIYDQYSGRFIAITLGGTSSPDSWLMLGISETSNPTGNWSKWAIDADEDGGIQTPNWADYPDLGIDANYVYVTANMFNSSHYYNYSKIWVVNKTQLLNGSSNITVTEFSAPTGYGFAMQPTHVFGSSSAEYLVDEGYYLPGLPPQRFLNINKITFSGGTPIWTNLGFIEVTSYSISGLPDAPQLGIGNTIETNDERLLNTVLRNGYIWTTHTVYNDANAKTEVAWYQINPASALPWPLYGIPIQQGRINDANRWYYFPSIAVNSNGSVGIGFSGSSTTEYAGAYYTARITSDTNGTMQPVALLKAGLAPYFKDFSSGSNRWGDYSATVVDPSDDRTFWTLQEYANTPANTWGTWWGKFVPASDLIAPSITSSSPPSPVTDTAGAVRTFDITVNQTVNVKWYINGTEVFNQTGVTVSSYTNTSAAAGSWNVTAVANNTNGTAMKAWDWVVEDVIIDTCTIITSPGNYVLNRSIMNSGMASCINITSSNVTFDGAGYTVDGNDSIGTYGIYITRENVTVKNLTVTDWDYGIYYLAASNGTIENNNLSSNRHSGVYLYSSSNDTINNNTANNNTIYGIYLKSSSNNNVTKNTVNFNTLTGIFIEYSSSNNTISNNTLNNNSDFGIYIYDSSNNNTLSSNIATNHRMAGIQLGYSRNNILVNNTARFNRGGISLSSGDFASNNTAGSNTECGIAVGNGNSTLINNSMTDNTYNFCSYGTEASDFNSSIDTSNRVDGKPIFYLKNASDSIYDSSSNAGTLYCILCNNITVRDLTLSRNDAGIFFWGTNNSRLENITAVLNRYGLDIRYSNYNTLINNNINSNYYDGMSLFYSSNNTISNNIANLNDEFGIGIGSSNNNTLTGNNATNNNATGIFLSDANESTLSSNTGNSNSFFGVLLEYSANNTVFNNTAISNAQAGILVSSSRNITLKNNTANSNSIYGIALSSTNDSRLIDDTASNNSFYDFGSGANSLNNTVINLSIPLTVSFTGKDIAIKSSSSPSPDPGGYRNISKYINATNTSSDSWLFLNVSYSDADLTDTIESTLAMWRYNGSAWLQVGGTNGVNTAQNYVYANITSFSTFAPMGMSFDIDSCTTISISGTYRLVQNITSSGYSTCIEITASNVTFDSAGHTINGVDNAGSYGIYAHNLTALSNITVKNITVTDWYYGIYFDSVLNGSINNSIVKSNSNGITLLSSSNNTLINNTISNNNWYGIYLSSSWNNTLSDNIIKSNSNAGIYLENSHSNIIANNSANNNVQRGIYLGSMSNNNTIVNNSADLNTQYGIYLGNSHSNIIANNSAGLNTQYGIYLWSSNNNTIANNSASNNTGTGIYLFSTNDNTVTSNIVSANQQFGISIHTSNSITLTNNTVNNNTFNGIHLFTSGSSNLTGNTVNSNHDNGIVIQSSSGNILLSNVASNNSGHGIYLAYSDDNTLINNTLHRNSNDGISIQFSDSNTLSKNTANSNSDGIYLGASSGNAVSDNTANSNTNVGIRLQTVSNSTLINNSMTNNTYNFDITGNQESDFNNTINQGNVVDGKPIFYFFKNGSDNVYDSTSNAGAIYCILCSNVTIRNLTFTKNNAGVFFWGTNNSKIENITATLNKAGINIAYSNNTTIASNNVSSNINGIYQTFSGGNTLSNITALSNAQYGIAIYNSNNNTLTNSNISMNGDGIILEESNNNTFSNNSAASNFDSGIFLGYSDYNSLSNSTAYNSTLYGIYLMSSSSNTFINTNSSSNTWDFYSILGSINNSVVNFSIPLPISFTGKDIAIRSASPPADDPPGYRNLSRYINATNTSSDSWLLWNVSYDESEVMNLNESSLRIWRYKNSAWSQVNGTNGVNTAQNYVYANITSFSTFAPMGASDTTPPSVTNLSVTPSMPQENESVNITVSASDVNMNFTAVFVSVKHPDNYTNTSQMLGNGSYYYVYTNTSKGGRYNITINASDVLGNYNNTQSTWFVAVSTTSLNLSDGDTAVGYGPRRWNRTNFPGFVDNEELSVLNVSDRLVAQNDLWYNTTANITQYNVNRNDSSKLVENALDQNGTKQAAGGYYARLGWMGASYVAFNGKVNKTATLVLEQGITATDKKTLAIGETWDMGDGYTLTVQAANATQKQAWLALSKNGAVLDDKIVNESDVYNYSIGSSAGESNVPIFVTYVDSIFEGTTDMVQLRYTWLISDSVTIITLGETFGNLVASQFSDTSLNLTNLNSGVFLNQSNIVNLMERLYFNAIDSASLEYYPFMAPIHVDALASADTTLDIFEKSGMAGSINITVMSDTPPGINRSFGMTPFGKFISINATPNVVGNLSWVKIRMFYTGSELSASGLTESSLKIARYNESAAPQQWEVLTTSLNTTDTGIYTGSVEANVSHLSYYGIVGNPVSTSPPSSPTPCTGCGGGGGGGGGGGTSGENFTNIEIKEKHDLYISKDTAASYRFNYTDPIIFVNITSNISAGDVTTSVEVLKNTSTLVKSPAPDVVYKNVNIWVGTSGFAVPKNIKQGIIVFRVLNSWLADNGIGSIRMVKWNGSAWVDIETKESSRDETHTYYEAETDSFSPFAITGVKGRATVEVTGTPAGPTETVTPAATQMEEPGGLNEILKITAAILTAITAILAAVYVKEQRKR